MNNIPTIKNFGQPYSIALTNGTQWICAEHHENGFVNWRIGVSTNPIGDVIFLNIDGVELNVMDRYGFEAALKLNIPRIQFLCPPLADTAKEILDLTEQN